MAPVPAYDLSMDELSMALSYVSAGLITSAPAAAPAAAPAVAKSAAPAPAKAEKPKKVSLGGIAATLLFMIITRDSFTYSTILVSLS